MPRERLRTLTEQMYYTLLCLQTECCGTEILERVKELTGGRVSIGSGTLYTLLDQFREDGYIQQTGAFGRRRTYLLSSLGKEILDREYERIVLQAEDYRRALNWRFGHETEKTGAEVLCLL